LLLLSGQHEQALTELTMALARWRERPFGYIPELDQAMNRLAQAGHCAWLAGDWPSPRARRMTSGLERDRAICEGLDAAPIAAGVTLPSRADEAAAPAE
jgi:hypothetical protein